MTFTIDTAFLVQLLHSYPFWACVYAIGFIIVANIRAVTLKRLDQRSEGYDDAIVFSIFLTLLWPLAAIFLIGAFAIFCIIKVITLPSRLFK